MIVVVIIIITVIIMIVVTAANLSNTETISKKKWKEWQQKNEGWNYINRNLRKLAFILISKIKTKNKSNTILD